MKPINAEENGCSPTSSNCVIWQGKDIPCISLCNGDTISDVVYKLTIELCDVLDQLDVSTYDISCLGLANYVPTDFHDFFQVLINKICELRECCDSQTDPDGFGGCPDCIVNVAPCFYYTNELGDQVTTMQLKDYIIAIGNRTCTNSSDISTINVTLADHEVRITALESEGPSPTPEIMVTPICTLAQTPVDIATAYYALEQHVCAILTALGEPNELFQAISKQAPGLAQQKTLSNTGETMSALPGWSNIVEDVADSIGNIWLTINDIRAAVKTIQANLIPTCDSISLALQGVLVSDESIKLYLTGNIPSGFVTCNSLGTLVTISDTTGGSFTQYVDIVAIINNPTGYAINIAGTPINTASNINIDMQPCLRNDNLGSTCQSVLHYTIVNESNCPNVTYNVTQGSIEYTASSITGTATYTVELWNNAGGTMLSSQVQTLTYPEILHGTFLGLSFGTNYKIRVKVTINDVDNFCPFTTVTTLPSACPAPTNVIPEIVI